MCSQKANCKHEHLGDLVAECIKKGKVRCTGSASSLPWHLLYPIPRFISTAAAIRVACTGSGVCSSLAETPPILRHPQCCTIQNSDLGYPAQQAALLHVSHLQLTRKVVLELEDIELIAHAGVVGNIDVIKKKERQAYTALYFKQDK